MLGICCFQLPKCGWLQVSTVGEKKVCLMKDIFIIIIMISSH